MASLLRLQVAGKPRIALLQTPGYRMEPVKERNVSKPFDLKQRTFGYDWPVQVSGCWLNTELSWRCSLCAWQHPLHGIQGQVAFTASGLRSSAATDCCPACMETAELP